MNDLNIHTRHVVHRALSYDNRLRHYLIAKHRFSKTNKKHVIAHF